MTGLRETLDAFQVTDQRLRRTCIYVTGSIGRGEATEHSDLDIFLLDLGDPKAAPSEPGRALGRIEQVLVKADVIRAAEQAGFQPFSGDGAWLSVHTADEMLALLGSRQDDARNLFTARLLLLLEGIPLLNEPVYHEATTRIVGAYWRDYPANPDEFVPIMLVNDVMRFWKTLTLNYEAKRNAGCPDDEDPGAWRAKRRLDAFKLGFSRLWICHSALAYLVWLGAQGPVTQAQASRMFALSPSERLEQLAQLQPDTAALVADILNQYSWFLDITDHAKDHLLTWISDRDERHAARTRNRAFGASMYDLIARLNGPEGPLLRFLVV